MIVGAGIAGLYAAHNLFINHPNLSVLVLEANNYLGGRIKTDETFAAPMRLALGAEFIHE